MKGVLLIFGTLITICTALGVSSQAFAEDKAHVVLFVIDNSIGMSTYQNRLARVIPELIKMLPKNLEIYVGSAEPGSKVTLIEDSSESEKLLREAILRRQEPLCTSPGFHASSCEHSQPRGIIVASDILAGVKNPIGQIDIIVLSNKDENFDGSELIPPETAEGFLADQSTLANLQPRADIRFHSIIVRPGDVACLSAQNERNGFYGSNYARLSDLTGGIVVNICDQDYSSLKSLAASIKVIKSSQSK